MEQPVVYPIEKKGIGDEQGQRPLPAFSEDVKELGQGWKMIQLHKAADQFDGSVRAKHDGQNIHDRVEVGLEEHD